MRPIASLCAFAVGTCGLLTTGWADDYNPFAEEPSRPAALAPAPTEYSFADDSAPMPYEGGETTSEQAHPADHAHPNSEGAHGIHGEHDMHDKQEMHGEHGLHEEHGHHEHHGGHGGHGHHEEPVGNIRITPLYREIESDIWNSVFDNMYSINIGTTFWQPEHEHYNYSTQVGLVTEFQFSSLDGKSGTNISSVTSIPFATRENLRVRDAEIYAGNIGLSFVWNTYLPDSCTKLELGVTPLLTIGSLNADLEPNTPAAGQRSIVLSRGASDNGTLVGGDFRLWTGIKTESGLRAGITGFYGVAETDAIFDSSQTFNTYGGGMYLEMPTRFVPHEFPAPMGAFQWIEETFGLH